METGKRKLDNIVWIQIHDPPTTSEFDWIRAYLTQHDWCPYKKQHRDKRTG